MFPRCSHITRKRGVYYYRRRLPIGVGGEIAFSLQTRVFREAEWLAQRLDPEFKAIIERVMLNQTKTKDISEIVSAYLKRKLDADMQHRIASPKKPLFPADADEKTIVKSDLEFAEGELKAAETELQTRAYDHQRPLIDELMEAHGVPEEQRDALAHGIFQANVKLWKVIRERTLGEFSEASLTLAAPKEAPSNTATGSLFSVALLPFLQQMKSNAGWRGQTLAQNKATYRMFTECCGDREVSTYGKKDLAKFYDLLRSLPALYSKSKAWVKMTTQEIADATRDDASIQRMTMKTVKRHMSALGKFFDYLKRRGETEGENPAHGFEYPDKRRANSKRQMWEGEKLSKLFASPVWAGCASPSRRSVTGKLVIKDEKYWLPLLGLFHGNRLEEFAQLTRGDVKSEEGIWYFDINDEGTKQVKNAQSKRRVPIHPRMMQLGFLDYVKEAAKNPDDRLFPNLVPGGADKKLGFHFTKWWTLYRKAVKVYEKGFDYHSFRHGVATKLAGAGVSLDARNELLGHEGASVDEKVYQKGLPLKVLADAIAKIEWPEVKLVIGE